MFDSIRKSKQPTESQFSTQASPKPRMNIDVNEQPVAFQQPAPSQQMNQQGQQVEQVYTIPQKFLPQQSEQQLNNGGALSGGPGGKKKKIWIILGIVITLVLLGLIGVVAYVFQKSSQEPAQPTAEQTQNTQNQQPTNENNQPNENNASIVENNASNAIPLNTEIPPVNEDLQNDINNGLFENNANSNENVNDENTNSAGTPPDFSNIGDTTDTDQDALTDEEEKNVYGTGEKRPDTDGDGYIDGTEIKNLYSPNKENETLLKSGLVIEEKNKDFGWSIYYPAQWLVEPLDSTNSEVLFTPDKVDTEFVEVIVQDNPEGLTAAEWYADQYENFDPNSIKDVKIGGLNGIQTTDGFTYYLADDTHIVGIIYNVGNSEDVNFRTTFTMMVDSFLYTGTKQPAEDAEKERNTNNADNSNQ